MDGKSGSVLNEENSKTEEGSWWRRRTKLEKKLLVFAVLILIISVILLIVLIVQSGKSSMSKQSDICVTPSCVRTAARIVDRANFSADPCEDFYEYACGSWMKKAVIADDQIQNSIFTNLNDKLSSNLRKIFEAHPKEGEAVSMQKVRDLYKSCLDQDKLEARGGYPLVNTLSEFGGWPVLDTAWDGSSFQLKSALNKLAYNNQYPLILMGMEFNPHNTSEYMLSFDQPALGILSRDYYLRGRNFPAMTAYEKFITKIAEALGADPSRAAKDAKEIVDFEIELAKITVSAIQRTNLTEMYNLITVGEMAKKYPEFDWLGYLQGIMSMDGIGISIAANDIIINKSPAYFEKLFVLLGNTQTRVQANYVMWIFTMSRVKLLSSKFRNIAFDFSKMISGSSTLPPRWENCVGVVNTLMPSAVGRLFADAYFDETAKSTMIELISYLRGAFNELIQEADWMDDVTRAVAQEKANVILEKIGYPEALKNNTFIDEDNKVEVNAAYYYENYNKVYQKAVAEGFRLLRDVVDKSRWVKPSASVGAFYNPSWNEIIFPAGILQPPFFDETQPKSINFGSIGSFIGHEITHGFDTTGRQFDKNGALRQWWANDVIQRFQDRVKCFIEQTSNFYVPEAEMNVNGQLTQGEDVADNGGMKESYRGYRKWVSKQGKEEALLPAVPLDHNQLFFLGWAQVWCTRIRPQIARFFVLGDTHSPNRIRAFSPMRNMPEFAQAYNCPKGSHMNPVKKCSVW